MFLLVLVFPLVSLVLVGLAGGSDAPKKTEYIVNIAKVVTSMQGKEVTPATLEDEVLSSVQKEINHSIHSIKNIKNDYQMSPSTFFSDYSVIDSDNNISKKVPPFNISKLRSFNSSIKNNYKIKYDTREKLEKSKNQYIPQKTLHLFYKLPKTSKVIDAKDRAEQPHSHSSPNTIQKRNLWLDDILGLSRKRKSNRRIHRKVEISKAPYVFFIPWANTGDKSNNKNSKLDEIPEGYLRVSEHSENLSKNKTYSLYNNASNGKEKFTDNSKTQYVISLNSKYLTGNEKKINSWKPISKRVKQEWIPLRVGPNFSNSAPMDNKLYSRSSDFQTGNALRFVTQLKEKSSNGKSLNSNSLNSNIFFPSPIDNFPTIIEQLQRYSNQQGNYKKNTKHMQPTPLPIDSRGISQKKRDNKYITYERKVNPMIKTYSTYLHVPRISNHTKLVPFSPSTEIELNVNSSKLSSNYKDNMNTEINSEVLTKYSKLKGDPNITRIPINESPIMYKLPRKSTINTVTSNMKLPTGSRNTHSMLTKTLQLISYAMTDDKKAVTNLNNVSNGSRDNKKISLLPLEYLNSKKKIGNLKRNVRKSKLRDFEFSKLPNSTYSTMTAIEPARNTETDFDRQSWKSFPSALNEYDSASEVNLDELITNRIKPDKNSGKFLIHKNSKPQVIKNKMPDSDLFPTIRYPPRLKRGRNLSGRSVFFPPLLNFPNTISQPLPLESTYSILPQQNGNSSPIPSIPATIPFNVNGYSLPSASYSYSTNFRPTPSPSSMQGQLTFTSFNGYPSFSNSYNSNLDPIYNVPSIGNNGPPFPMGHANSYLSPSSFSNQNDPSLNYQFPSYSPHRVSSFQSYLPPSAIPGMISNSYSVPHASSYGVPGYTNNQHFSVSSDYNSPMIHQGGVSSAYSPPVSAVLPLAYDTPSIMIPASNYGIPLSQVPQSAIDQSYGLPIPDNVYGVPQSTDMVNPNILPSNSYGTPNVPAPSTNYGTPLQSYVPPVVSTLSPSYGLPNNKVPSYPESTSVKILNSSYGIPYSRQPNQSYDTPSVSRPVQSYGAPNSPAPTSKGSPSPTYGTPSSVKPSQSYGNSIPKRPSTGYNTPAVGSPSPSYNFNNVKPAKIPSQSYGSPPSASPSGSYETPPYNKVTSRPSSSKRYPNTKAPSKLYISPLSKPSDTYRAPTTTKTKTSPASYKAPKPQYSLSPRPVMSSYAPTTKPSSYETKQPSVLTNYKTPPSRSKGSSHLTPVSRPGSSSYVPTRTSINFTPSYNAPQIGNSYGPPKKAYPVSVFPQLQSPVMSTYTTPSPSINHMGYPMQTTPSSSYNRAPASNYGSIDSSTQRPPFPEFNFTPIGTVTPIPTIHHSTTLSYSYKPTNNGAASNINNIFTNSITTPSPVRYPRIVGSAVNPLLMQNRVLLANNLLMQYERGNPINSRLFANNLGVGAQLRNPAYNNLPISQFPSVRAYELSLLQQQQQLSLNPLFTSQQNLAGAYQIPNRPSYAYNIPGLFSNTYGTPLIPANTYPSSLQPLQSYGAPSDYASQLYGAPANYLSQSYGVPTDYPSRSYGAPVGIPLNSYGPPVQDPSNLYAALTQNPSNSYGAPTQNPLNYYGAPTPRPSNSYGIPSQNPINSYGAPTQHPSNFYRAPSQNPTNSYRAPTEYPSRSYGPPPDTRDGYYKKISQDQYETKGRSRTGSTASFKNYSATTLKPLRRRNRRKRKEGPDTNKIPQSVKSSHHTSDDNSVIDNSYLV